MADRMATNKLLGNRCPRPAAGTPNTRVPRRPCRSYRPLVNFPFLGGAPRKSYYGMGKIEENSASANKMHNFAIHIQLFFGSAPKWPRGNDEVPPTRRGTPFGKRSQSARPAAAAVQAKTTKKSLSEVLGPKCAEAFFASRASSFGRSQPLRPRQNKFALIPGEPSWPAILAAICLRQERHGWHLRRRRTFRQLLLCSAAGSGLLVTRFKKDEEEFGREGLAAERLPGWRFLTPRSLPSGPLRWPIALRPAPKMKNCFKSGSKGRGGGCQGREWFWMGEPSWAV